MDSNVPKMSSTMPECGFLHTLNVHQKLIGQTPFYFSVPCPYISASAD